MNRVGLNDFNSVPAAPGTDLPRVLTYEEILQVYVEERSRPEWQPVKLGFGSLDTAIRGISPGQVMGIAARTSVGKTWMLQTVEHNFSARRDAGCLSLTLEMPGPEWAERALAIHEGVEPSRIEAIAKDNEHSKAAFLARMENVRIVERGVALDELPSLVLEGRASLAVPLRLLLIDYLGMLRVRGDAYERASRIGMGLKQLAKAERLAIIVAMQVSRAGGDGSCPVGLEMLRDSGVLEESVDFLIGAWQPGRADGLSEVEEKELKNVLRIRVLKSRKGGDGKTMDLHFHAQSRCLYEEAVVIPLSGSSDAA
jgi:replicative DNA helicase